MEYIFALLILVGFWGLSTILSSFLGISLIILYASLGFYLGIDSLTIGIGGLLGSLVNIRQANRYYKTQQVLSSAPKLSKLSSIAYVIFFAIGVSITMFKEGLPYYLSEINIIIILIIYTLLIINITIQIIIKSRPNIENSLIWQYLSFESLWLKNYPNIRVDYAKLLTASSVLILQNQKYNTTSITTEEIYKIAYEANQKYLNSEYDVRSNTLLVFTLNFITTVNIRSKNPDADIEMTTDCFQKEFDQLNKSKILKNVIKNINTNKTPLKHISLASKFIDQHPNWYESRMYKFDDIN